MRIFLDNLENVTQRRALFCVWKPACQGEPTRLAARWIDSQAEAHETLQSDDSCSKEEAGGVWLGMSLQIA